MIAPDENTKPIPVALWGDQQLKNSSALKRRIILERLKSILTSTCEQMIQEGIADNMQVRIKYHGNELVGFIIDFEDDNNGTKTR